jgi:hypothetical protein
MISPSINACKPIHKIDHSAVIEKPESLPDTPQNFAASDRPNRVVV